MKTFLALFLLFFPILAPLPAQAKACDGDPNCTVCTDCSRCAYCRGGGVCGVKARLQGSLHPQQAIPPPMPISGPAPTILFPSGGFQNAPSVPPTPAYRRTRSAIRRATRSRFRRHPSTHRRIGRKSR